MSGTRALGPRHPNIHSFANRKGYVCILTWMGKNHWGQHRKTIAEAEGDRRAMLEDLQLSQPRPLKRLGVGRRIDLTVADFLRERWLPSLEAKPQSLSLYAYSVRRILTLEVEGRALGEYRLRDLTPALMESVKMAQRDAGHARETRNQDFTRLRSALRRAVDWELLPRNVAAQVKAPAKGESRKPELALDDICRILAVADEMGYGLPVWLAVLTGLREGELIGLEWSRVDFAEMALRVQAGKTPNAYRMIAIPPGLVERLRAHRHEQMKARDAAGKDPSPWVLTNDAGNQWRGDRWRQTWAIIRRQAGFEWLHFHDLRHVHSTFGQKAGMSPAAMQHRLGQADPSITLGIYTHMTAMEDQREGARRLEEMLNS